MKSTLNCVSTSSSRFTLAKLLGSLHEPQLKLVNKFGNLNSVNIVEYVSDCNIKYIYFLEYYYCRFRIVKLLAPSTHYLPNNRDTDRARDVTMQINLEHKEYLNGPIMVLHTRPEDSFSVDSCTACGCMLLETAL